MKFTKKIKPEVGNKRNKIKFAWLPKKINNTIIWLENYKVYQTYYDMKDFSFWLNIKEEIIYKNYNDY